MTAGYPAAGVGGGSRKEGHALRRFVARMRNYETLVVVVVLSALGMGGCPGPNPPGGQSDVPCFEPDWAVEVIGFGLRPDVPDSAVLLMTVQTFEDATADSEDGIRDYIPHRAVYRFNPDDETVELVDDAVWDGATGAVSECCTGFRPEPPFDLDENRLYFDGRVVPVAGGQALAVSQAPSDRVIAALSANGTVSLFFRLASGQHFHQLFSRSDGSPVGPASRLAVGGRENGSVLFDWTPDERYVVYEQALQKSGNTGIGRVCIVPVSEALATLEK